MRRGVAPRLLRAVVCLWVSAAAVDGALDCAPFAAVALTLPCVYNQIWRGLCCFFWAVFPNIRAAPVQRSPGISNQLGAQSDWNCWRHLRASSTACSNERCSAPAAAWHSCDTSSATCTEWVRSGSGHFTARNFMQWLCVMPHLCHVLHCSSCALVDCAS